MNFVLASASPRRRELLEQAGWVFEVRPSAVSEVRGEGEDPVAFAVRLAREKAAAVARDGEWVLGADTVVIAPSGEVLGKPQDRADAARMIRLLAGGTHQVVTGVCLRGPDGGEQVASELTYVTFLSMSDAEIEAYVRTGEPMDKAGAYAIQGRAAKWTPRVQGCFYNVVGLPLALVSEILATRR